MAWFDDIDVTQKLVWEERFANRDKDNVVTEKNVQETFIRIAKELSKVETDSKYWNDKFFEVMNNGYFIPAGRVLSNLGTNNNNAFNCFVLDVEDDLSSIFDTIKEMALIQQRGGGTGFNFSKLRPKGEYAVTSNSHSSGPCSFISAFNTCSDVIRSGSRRAANMAILSIYHPDIKEFILFKSSNPGSWERFNVSVDVDEAFIEKVKNKEKVQLVHNGKVYDEVDAVELWNLVCENAWKYGDPGIIDLSYANQDFDYVNLTGSPVVASNPCSEKIMHQYDQCCLGSINLVQMLDYKNSKIPLFNTDRFRETIKIANRMLDNVYDTTTYILPQNREIAMKYRRVGIGIMGFADMLYLMGTRYSQSEVVINKMMEEMVEIAFESSCDLAIEKGKNSLDPEKYIEAPFVKRNLSRNLIEKIRNNGIRNMNILSFAPTGTISMFTGVSSGIEPVFSHSYWRKDALTNESRETLHKTFEICSQKDNFKELKERKVFETAHDLSPEEHVHIHGQFASYVDSNISKTTNLPNNATVEDVSRTFLMAREYGIKSTTVYRDGSRNQVLTTKQSEFCPDCGNETQTDSNCKSCPNCGWSVCSI